MYMSLASGVFVLFLAGVCVVSYAIPCRFRYLFLLATSYAFYLYSPQGFMQNLPALALLLSATIISYLCALALQKSEQKSARIFWLVLSLANGLGMLLVFKYANGVVGLITSSGGLNLLMPLGMGYYTLQATSYIIDVYRKKISAEQNPFRYALYVSFFPGIVTGPINRAPQMLAQYKTPKAFSYSYVSGGLFRVLWGLVKKLVISDHLSKITSSIFSSPAEQTGPILILGILVFAYHLYIDFSGSCDIAIGAARMLGFSFTENFKRPFAAKTYIDFWHRWHISLTSFFRDYLYFPLGGSRVPRWRWALNTVLVFVVSALWHGEGWGYLVWGLLSGLFLVVAKLYEPHKERLVARIPLYRIGAVRGVFQRIFVYLLFSFTLFSFAFTLYATPLADFFTQLSLGWSAPADFLPHFSSFGLDGWILAVLPLSILLVELVECFAVSDTGTVADWIRARRWFVRWPLYYLLLMLLLAFGLFGQSAFIYQQY